MGEKELNARFAKVESELSRLIGIVNSQNDCAKKLEKSLKNSMREVLVNNERDKKIDQIRDLARMLVGIAFGCFILGVFVIWFIWILSEPI